MRIQMLRCHLHNMVLIWGMSLLIMLEDDAAMLAFMWS